MKEGAETVQTKIQAKAESVLKQGGDMSKGKKRRRLFMWDWEDNTLPNSQKKLGDIGNVFY